MSIVSMRDMLEAGVHFGHQSRYWNPKMAPYIFGERNRIHIINLEVTLPLYQEAINFLGRMAASNGTVLFVGTKRAAQEVIRREAIRCGMPYVDQRWLGGMLTNFKTVRASIARLREMDAMEEDGRVQRMSKKEALGFRRALAKLQRSLGGIKHSESLPDVLYVVDVGHEKIAVREADKLGIPIVGVVDTNHEPDRVDYVIPGNDDATRAIELYSIGVADAIIEARQAAHLETGAGAKSGAGPDAEDAAAGNGAAAPAAAGEPVAETLSDRIRQHVLTHHIAPARDAGENVITVRAGDVSREMGLQDRVPAVCAALRSRKFRDLADVDLTGDPDRQDGATTTFDYTVGGAKAGN